MCLVIFHWCNCLLLLLRCMVVNSGSVLWSNIISLYIATMSGPVKNLAKQFSSWNTCAGKAEGEKKFLQANRSKTAGTKYICIHWIGSQTLKDMTAALEDMKENTMTYLAINLSRIVFLPENIEQLFVRDLRGVIFKLYGFCMPCFAGAHFVVCWIHSLAHCITDCCLHTPEAMSRSKTPLISSS